MSADRPFNFTSPLSFHAWYGDAAIVERLLSEWGWIIDRREPASPDALAQFLAFAPEPGLDAELENAVLSHWNDWHVLVTYFGFGGLREIYNNYPVPIIEIAIPAGSDLVRLGDASDFYLDLMVGQRYYYTYVRDGVLWRSEMELELGRNSEGRFVLQNNAEWAVKWHLGEGTSPGYGFQNHITFSSNLGQNLESLGLPIRHWQNRGPDIVNESFEMVKRPYNKR